MNIWVPRTKILEPEILLPGARVSGRFRIIGRLDDGRERVLQDWTSNLITNGGLERWGTGSPIVNCSVGGGSTPPSVLDSALVSFLRQHNTVAGHVAGADTAPPYYGWWRGDFIFNPPGSNLALAEIGIGWGTNGTNLWSRTLTKDGSGNPLVLSWLANETLTISYEARKYPWLVDVPHTTVIAGVTYDGIIRPSLLGNAGWAAFHNRAQTTASDNSLGQSYLFSGTIGALTGSPSGSLAAVTSTNNAYSAGSLQATGSATAGPTVANFAGGVGALRVPSLPCGYQVSFTPTIAKLSTHTLTFNVSSGVWGRKP